MTAARPFLPGYAVFAAMLASAGLPIYIHAPKFYVDEYGVSLAALGIVLFGLRLFDVVQDPVLGWLSEAARRRRRIAVATAGAVLAASMFGLFAVEPPVNPLLWFGLTLTGLFTAFSFLTICFYAQGVRAAGSLGDHGHTRLAGWRETGALLGISVAAVTPTVLAGLSGNPFALFAAGFGGLVLLAVFAMRHEWRAVSAAPASGVAPVLSDGLARRLLLIALVNATPVAVTSTLVPVLRRKPAQCAGGRRAASSSLLPCGCRVCTHLVPRRRTVWCEARASYRDGPRDPVLRVCGDTRRGRHGRLCGYLHRFGRVAWG